MRSAVFRRYCASQESSLPHHPLPSLLAGQRASSSPASSSSSSTRSLATCSLSPMGCVTCFPSVFHFHHYHFDNFTFFRDPDSTSHRTRTVSSLGSAIIRFRKRPARSPHNRRDRRTSSQYSQSTQPPPPPYLRVSSPLDQGVQSPVHHGQRHVSFDGPIRQQSAIFLLPRERSSARFPANMLHRIALSLRKDRSASNSSLQLMTGLPYRTLLYCLRRLRFSNLTHQ